MNIESSLAYLDKIPSLHSRSRRSMTDEPDAPLTDSNAGVIGPQLIAFTSGLDREFKEAVKFSTQMAQRLADHQFNQVTQRMEWYEAYCTALKHSGWIGSDNKLTEYKNSNLEITMEDVAIELVKLAAGPNAVRIAELVSTTVNALKNDGDVSAKLQASSSSGSSGSFDILPCIQEGDEVVMYNHSMVFSHSNSAGGLWFWSWKLSQVSLQHAANEWTFNYASYQLIEDKIKEKLGKSSNDFFDSINF